MKKIILFILVIVLSTFFLVQIGLAAASNPEYKMRCSIGCPDSHFIGQQFIDWANLIKEKTDGRVEVELYFNGQLYSDKDVIEAIQTGAIEAGLVYTFRLATMISEFEIFNMPMLFDTTAEEEKVLNGSYRKNVSQ